MSNTRNLIGSENHFRVIVENAPIGMSLTALDGQFIHVNKALCDIVGYSREELEQLTWRAITHPDDMALNESQTRQLLAGQISSFRIEKRYICRNGHPIWLLLAVSLIRDDAGTPLFYISQMENISERKQTERIRAESEQKFRMLFEAANDCMLILTLDGHIVDINRSGHERLGYTREEMLGRRIAEFDTPEFAAQLQENMKQVIRVGHGTLESAHVHKSGTVMPVEVSAKIVELGGESRIFSIIRDITARKHLEAELRDSELRHRQMFEINVATQLLIDPDDGRIVNANQSAINFYGYPREQLLGMAISNINIFSPDEILAEMDLARQHKRRYFNFRHRLASGTIRDVEVYSGPIDLAGKQLLYSIVHDITDRLRAEAAFLRESRKNAFLFEAASDGIHIIDLQGKLIQANDAFSHMLGYTPGEILGMHVAQWDVQWNAEELQQRIPLLMKHGALFETRHRRKDGTIINVEVSATAVNFDDEDFLFCMSRDITERKQQQEELQLAALAFQNSSEAVSVTDENNRIIAVNPAFTQMTGYTAAEVLGTNPHVLSSDRHDASFYREMWQSLNTSGQWQGEIWERRKDGELIAEWLSINTIYGPDGAVHRRLAQFSDITKKKQSEEIIWRQANFDLLTQLPNRRMFRDRLEQEIKKAHRAHARLALFFIDLDRFKEVNDTMGHHVGDLLLMEAANRITACVRESDTVARLGGDEFTVILTEMSDETQVERVAQEIIARLTEPFRLGEEVAYISASIGITLYPDDSADAESLLKHADQAMYAAKNEGRNRYSYFTPMLQEVAMARLRMINELRSALAENQFRVWFQPIVDLSSGGIHKAEALLRWHHPYRGIVSPMEFIPLAEETGLINEIGDWVFMESMRWTKRWSSLFSGGIQVSVNKSPVQFKTDGNTPDTKWPDFMREIGLPGSSLVVEITESLLLNADSGIFFKLLEFRNAGIQVAIDDFGTGYSSLAYLKKFDIDYLKIDQVFVRNLETDTNDQALVEAIVMMAHKLGLKVIAEGVETAGQRSLLMIAGCDYAQGYLFSKPVPPEELESLLTALQS